MKRALLFDLDETLMVEEPAAAAAFAATDDPLVPVFLTGSAHAPDGAG